MIKFIFIALIKTRDYKVLYNMKMKIKNKVNECIHEQYQSKGKVHPNYIHTKDKSPE